MGLARVIVLAAAGALALSPAAGAQGLGDASKKEKQRREQSKAPPARTYTQEELAKLPPVANEGDAASRAAAPPPARPAASGASRPVPPDDEEKTRARDEGVWRSRVARAQARVEKARSAHATLAGMNLVPGYEYVDERGRTVIGSIGELQQLTAKAKAELDAAEKALQDLLEEARRANVPPGWLR